MEIINELMQNKPLFFSIISVLVATIIFVLYLIIKERKKDQDEIDDIMSSLVEPKRRPAVVSEIEEDEEEEKEEAIEKVVEEKTEEKPLDIEAMLEQMQKDLNTKAEDVVATFEQEQEENSIISYQELVRSLKGEKIAKEPVKVDTKEVKEPVQLSLDAVIEEDNAEKKFKNTDFISPVYGKMNEKLDYPTVPQFNKNDKEIEKELETYESNFKNKNINEFLGEFEFDNNIEVNSLEQTLNMKPLSEEIKKNDDFLKALKDFRKNLD